MGRISVRGGATHAVGSTTVSDADLEVVCGDGVVRPYQDLGIAGLTDVTAAVAAQAATDAAAYAPAVAMPAPSGDTTGATDTAAVQAAINAAPAGSEVVFRAGTYWFNAMLVLKSGCRYRGSSKAGTTLKQAAGANTVAFVATAEWANNATSSGAPVVVEQLTVDCNKAANSGTYGVVLLNYQSVIQHCYVDNAPLHGIVFSDKNSAGTVISNTAVENRVLHCHVGAPGGIGIWVIDTASSGKVTDGRCFANEVQNPVGVAIQVDRAAGWFVTENHVYGCQTDGIVLDAVWGTSCHDNEIDQFGMAGASTTYYGVRAVTIIAGRQSVFHDNQVSTTEQALSTYCYHAFRAPAGVSMPVRVHDNVAHKDGGSSVAAYGYTYQASATGTLTVYRSGNFTDVTTPVQTGGGGTVNLYGQSSDNQDLTPARHVMTTGATPGHYGGAALGASPPNPAVVGTDVAGIFYFGTGTGTSAGSVGGVNFATAYDSDPSVVITPRNALAAACGNWAAVAGTWGFDITCSIAPAGSQGPGAFELSYQVVGMS